VPLRLIAVLSCSASLAAFRAGRTSLSMSWVNVLSPEQATRLPRARMARFRTAPRESFSRGVRPARPSAWALGRVRML
jgi:hypothetical protein